MVFTAELFIVFGAEYDLRTQWLYIEPAEIAR